MHTTRPQRFRWRPLAALAFLAVLGWLCRAAVLALDPAFAAVPGLPAGSTQPQQDLDALAWSNAVPVLVAVLVLWCACGRALLAAWTVGWLLWALYAVDAIKFAHLHRHLSPGDLQLLPQVVGNGDLFVRYLPLHIGGVLAALAVVAVAALLAWREPRTLPPLRWRSLTLAASLLLATSLLRGDLLWRASLSDAALGEFRVWAPDGSLERSGLPAGLVRLGWESAVAAPAADRARLARFARRQAGALAARRDRVGPWQLPDIVVVQSEALFDPARLRGVEPAAALPQFRRLAAGGVHGQLTVPSLGGGTIRTEFEVLTGVPMSAFPQIAWPYFGLAMRPLPALPHALSALGYRTCVLHPYRRSFWNRDVALQRLGIAEGAYEDDPLLRAGARHGHFISDRALFAATLATLRDDRPQFALAITMENHGPWRRRPGIDEAARDAIRVPAGLTPGQRRELQNYLLHLRAGDEALGAFADALLARPRPTVLLVYGDHLPDLPSVFEQLGFDDGRSPWAQTVPYFVAANFELPQRRIDLESYLLPGLLLDLLELPSSGYLATNARIRELSADDSGAARGELRQTLHHAVYRELEGAAAAAAGLVPSP